MFRGAVQLAAKTVEIRPILVHSDPGQRNKRRMGVIVTRVAAWNATSGTLN